MSYLLIIDDDDDFVNALEIILVNAGYEVQAEHTITNGLQSMNNRSPDLLILDVMFPENGAAGLELAQMIRQEEKLKRVPILILSAINEAHYQTLASECIDEGGYLVQDFLEKPIDSDQLKGKVSTLLQRTYK